MHAATAITVAGIGLFGVLIGGIITAGANFILAVRRERVEAARDRRSYGLEVKRAARVIMSELPLAQALAKTAVEDRLWWSSDAQVKTDAWQKYGAVIAPELSVAEWSAVAYATVGHLLSFPRGPGKVTDADAGAIATILGLIDKGNDALSPYVL
jgi:hypothetical protein